MNTFQLILKNMRQRALSTSLTLLSVVLGVALAISVIILQREGEKLFVQSDFGYNLIVGPKGDPLRLVLNGTYGMGTAGGTIPWASYDDLMRTQQQHVRWAIPYMVGDTWQGKRIVATSNRLVSTPALDLFRKTLANLGDEMKRIGLPPQGETPDARAKRIAQVPDAIVRVESRLADLTDDAVASLDVELTGRLNDLRATLMRAAAMVETGQPNSYDAAGRIAADAVDQLRLLGSFAAPFEYRENRQLSLATGAMFDARKFEGVVGDVVARQLKLKVGDTFQLEHGGNARDVHEEKWTVTGILAPTNTAMDQTIFIPIVSALAVPEHEEGLRQIAELQANEAGAAPVSRERSERPTPAPSADGELMSGAKPAAAAAHDDHHDHDHHGAFEIVDGRIRLGLEASKWKVSGIFAQTRGAFSYQMLFFRYLNTPVAMAASPAEQMRLFFDTFMKGPTLILLALAVLVTIVAAISILVSIYNAVSARRREIAILRALGATRGRVLGLITLEATLIGVVGGVVGLLLGHAMAGVGGTYLRGAFGQTIGFWTVSGTEIAYLAGVALLAALAGLVPALQAYRVTVAENLVGE